MDKFNINQTIGDIVATLPSTENVLKRYNIDFYFQGSRTLTEVTQEKNIDGNKVLDELNSMLDEFSGDNFIDFRVMSTNELLNYIENTLHVNIIQLLNDISYLSKKVIRGNGPSHSHFFNVHKILHELRAKLEDFLQGKVEYLYSYIRKYEESPTIDLYDRINYEVEDIQKVHEYINDSHEKLIEISRGNQVPQDEFNSYALIFNKVQEIEENILVTAHLINNILLRKIMLVNK